MNQKVKATGDDIRPEYDLDYSKAKRGNYLERLLKNGSNVVILSPDVADVFDDSDSVNAALRSLIELSKKAGAAKKRRKRRPAGTGVQAVKG